MIIHSFGNPTYTDDTYERENPGQSYNCFVLFLELQPKMKNCGYRHSPGFLNKSNTTGATCGTGTSFHSGIPEFTPGFSAVRVARFFSFLCNVLLTVVCLFVIFLLTIVLSVDLS